MAVCYGADFEYANAKLSNSIVRYFDKPVYVIQVFTNLVARIKHLVGNTSSLDVPLGSLDLSPIPMGYCNWSDATYISRHPVRDWKQGLKSQHIHATCKFGSVNSIAFHNMVLGIYPDIMETINSLYCMESRKKAFSRLFSLQLGESGNNELLHFLYKDWCVGYLDVNNSFFPSLHKDYKYLAELVEETIHGTCV